MPELPEVETIKRELQRALKGLTITGVTVNWPKTIAPLKPAALARRVKGRKILAVARRAKVLIMELSGEKRILVHLKMTGQLIYAPSLLGRAGPACAGRGGAMIVGGHPYPPAGRGGVDNLPNKFTRVVISFGGAGKLFFNDMRKFGWLKLLKNEEAQKLLGVHGIEPLSRDFTDQHFIKLLKRYPRRKIKQVLLDQTIIAGLGNIYVDEACFLAKIRPTRITQSLRLEEQQSLHRSIIAVLKLSISKKGTSAKNYLRANGQPGGFVPHLNVYGRGGQPCKRCRTGIISKIKLNGRGTHFCPRCQK